MKVIILGAAGAMASVVIRDLLEFVPDISITAADVRSLTFPDSRLHSVIVDVTDEAGTARALEGHDVVINCVTYYFNIHAMKAALRARVSYADLGGLFHGTSKQFGLHEDFVRAGIPAVLGIGSTPGITNMMAGALVSQMDQVHELHVRVACMDESITGPLPVPYSLDTVLDEFALEPWVFKDGKLFPVPRMSGSEVIDFPAPVHKAEAIYTLHSEVAMFPRSFPGLREASFKVAFPQEFTQKMRFLVELGFASTEKLIGDVSPRQMLLSVASHQTSEPSEPRDCDVLRIHAKGIKGGRECTGFAESVILPHPQWKMAAGSLDTGVPLSVVSQMLARRTIRQPGVLCPEIGVPPEPFFEELKKRGIHVTMRVE